MDQRTEEEQHLFLLLQEQRIFLDSMLEKHAAYFSLEHQGLLDEVLSLLDIQQRMEKELCSFGETIKQVRNELQECQNSEARLQRELFATKGLASSAYENTQWLMDTIKEVMTISRNTFDLATRAYQEASSQKGGTDGNK